MEDFVDDSLDYLSPRKDLYEVFSHPEFSIRQRKKVIEALDDVDGFDITFVISHILNIRLMGHLNIVSENNEVSGITFGEGFIIHIDLPDKKTYIGQLLLEDGLIDHKILEEVVGQKDLPVGQFLLKKKYITEQQISDTMAKQMRLRLSKLICSETFKINFSEAPELSSTVHISQLDYYKMSHDWVAGRFDQEWLNMHFLPWESDEIVLLKNAPHQTDIFKLPLVAQLSDLITKLEKKISIKELKTIYPDNQILVLKVVYFLSMANILIFKSNTEYSGKNKNKLESIFLELKNKKDNELTRALSVLTKIHESDTESIYLSFLKLIEINSNDAEIEFKNELIKIGLNFLTNKKPQITKGIASKTQINSDITARALIAIQNDLLNNQYYDAMGKLKKIYTGANLVPSTKVYFLWAKVGHALVSKIKINIAACESELIQVLPEDKETAEFFYVKAMLAKLKKDEINCKNFYKIAVKKKIIFANYPIIKRTALEKLLGLVGIK